MATKHSRGCCERLRDRLYGVFVESCIISFSLLSALAVAVELLVTLDIIRAPPRDEQTDGASKATTQLTTGTTTRPIDPGGSTVDPLHITYLVCHYLSLGIAALFLLEILLKMLVSRKAFFVKFWQIFDAFVVIGAFSMEVVFTVMGTEVVWEDAATFVIILRLWRVFTVCNINAKKAKVELDQDIHIWKSAKTKCDEKCSALQDRLDRQQLKIVDLERQTTKQLAKMAKQQTHEKDESAQLTTVPELMCNGGIVSNGPIMTSAQRITDDTNHENESNRDDVNVLNDDVKSDTKTKDVGYDVTDGCDNPGDVKMADADLSQVAGQRRSDIDVSGNDARGCHSVVVVQIEEPSPQHAVALITDDTAKLINDFAVPLSYDNEVFDKEEEEIVLRDLPVLAKHVDGTTTYRSAEGIPMTTL